ncbi:uncharacterized protein LOC116840330 isoform X2 [Odontomachus brunneus]|uniref:uncharacterized protein LOC116840330 isoform X2 n=1 Tax=Odontomachus brunneus TaxID=486640 RepID=UPI0013F20EEA|nr:uncharacterized protein LOC116840330 isoform X2 [Odontomachus brunneus]
MSTKTDESKSLVPTPGVVESSCSFEDTIKPSDKFLQVFKLIYPFSKGQSKFNKKQIRTVEVKMDKLFHKVINSQDTKFEDVITLAYICQLICFAYIKSDQTQNQSAAKDSILRCLHLIKDKELDPNIILLALKAYYNLSYIYEKQQKLENAIEALDRAVDLYLKYMEEFNEYDIPIDYEDIIIKPSVQVNGYSKLKSLYRYILQVSTDIHIQMGSKSNESFMLSRHLLLVEELNCLQTPVECVKWIVKATTVCNYLITCKRFPEASTYINQLNVVRRILNIKFNDTKEKNPSSETPNIFIHKVAMFKLVILYHMKYGVALFCQSVKLLLRLEKNKVSKTYNSITKYLSELEAQTSRRLLMFVPNKKAYYGINTHHFMHFTYILKYNEAQKKFSNILNMIYVSELHRKFDDVNFFIQCKLYISNLYKYMAFYEKHKATQFLLRKKCAETLEEAANFLGDRNNSKLLRLLWLQLTIAYSTLIDMKLEDTEEANLPYLSQKHIALVDEINLLVAKSLIFLRKYKYSK